MKRLVLEERAAVKKPIKVVTHLGASNVGAMDIPKAEAEGENTT